MKPSRKSSCKFSIIQVTQYGDDRSGQLIKLNVYTVE